VDRHDQIETFDQAFYVFWRDPSILDRVMSLPLPKAKPELQDRRPPPATQRVLDALRQNQRQPPPEEVERHETTARLKYSEAEIRQYKDFEAMTSAELTRVRRALAHLRLPLKPLATRRHRPAARGQRVDMRATLRASLRKSPHI